MVGGTPLWKPFWSLIWSSIEETFGEENALKPCLCWCFMARLGPVRTKISKKSQLTSFLVRSPVGPVGSSHCSSADRYFQSLHSHGCDIPGLERPLDNHNLTHREHLEEGSESDSIESIYKKLSTPKVSIIPLPYHYQDKTLLVIVAIQPARCSGTNINQF